MNSPDYYDIANQSELHYVALSCIRCGRQTGAISARENMRPILALQYQAKIYCQRCFEDLQQSIQDNDIPYKIVDDELDRIESERLR